MSSKLSVEEVLANLEQRAVFHREQEALHAQKAVQHQADRPIMPQSSRRCSEVWRLSGKPLRRRWISRSRFRFRWTPPLNSTRPIFLLPAA